MDTIFALATAQGRAGVAVIRVSGPDAWSVATGLCGSVPSPRKAALRLLRGSDGDVLDQALVLAFKGPESFTGEDVVEFQVHGSIAVCRAVLERLGDDTGARLAEPGEFTRRALENNRLDLAQVEGLADLIDAETEAQRKQATRVFSGALTDQIEQWRKNLIRAAALLEATIDFADEDVPEDVSEEVRLLLTEVQTSLSAEIAGSHVSERIRTGFEVAIVGPPNVGKSTLLNRLAGREAAITSEIAGTTRDVIEVRMDLAGLPVTILDTAGLRESEDQIEQIGIARAMEKAGEADLRVFLTDQPEDLGILVEPQDIVVRPKADITSGIERSVSGLTGLGVDSLIESISEALKERSKASSLVSHQRHRLALEKGSEFIGSALSLLDVGQDVYELAAEEVRSAIRALDSVVGRIDVENLLDEIFLSFCLGK